MKWEPNLETESVTLAEGVTLEQLISYFLLKEKFPLAEVIVTNAEQVVMHEQLIIYSFWRSYFCHFSFHNPKNFQQSEMWKVNFDLYMRNMWLSFLFHNPKNFQQNEMWNVKSEIWFVHEKYVVVTSPFAILRIFSKMKCEMIKSEIWFVHEKYVVVISPFAILRIFSKVKC